MYPDLPSITVKAQLSNITPCFAHNVKSPLSFIGISVEYSYLSPYIYSLMKEEPLLKMEQKMKDPLLHLLNITILS